MANLLKFLTKNVTVVLLIALVVAGTVYVTGKVEGLVEFLFPDKVIAQHRYTIVTGLQAMGDLVTVKYQVAKTDSKVDIQRGFLGIGSYSAEHDIIGAVEAGIRFSEIDEDDVRFSFDVYTVTLPAPVITSCRIEYIDQNEYSFTLLSADWDMVRQIAHAEALEQFAEEMIEQGILERAVDEASISIGDFVRYLTGNPADIRFRDIPDEPELPDSCIPIAPEGWEKTEDGGWKRAS